MWGGHAFPVVDGVPVMLRDDVAQTQHTATKSLRQARGDEDLTAAPTWTDTMGVDPFVQEAVAATSGYLYKPVQHKLTTYPIPQLRLPAGDSDSRLLDVGCNWGRWCVAAGRLGYAPVGIDVNLEAVLAARRVLRSCSVEGDLVVADARYLPFRAATFQAVFSYSVLQHFSKDDACLAVGQIGRVLEQGHVALVQMPNQYGVRSIYHQARRGFRPGREFEVRYWAPGELRTTFTRLIGPTDVEVDGFFGLGIQASDAHLLRLRHQVVVGASEVMRRASGRARMLTNLADSLYLRSARSATGGEAGLGPFA